MKESEFSLASQSHSSKDINMNSKSTMSSANFKKAEKMLLEHEIKLRTDADYRKSYFEKKSNENRKFVESAKKLIEEFPPYGIPPRLTYKDAIK